MFDERAARIFARVVAEAWLAQEREDHGFLNRLRDDPEGVLRDHGLEIQEGYRVRSAIDGPEEEGGPTVTYLHIPLRPKDMTSHDLEGAVQINMCSPMFGVMYCSLPFEKPQVE